MANVDKGESSQPGTSSEIVKEEASVRDKTTVKEASKTEVKYFQCEVCEMRERFDYYGADPPFSKQFKLSENAYIIENPFLPPKQNEFVVLGSHCIKCRKSVCKDSNCSLYYDASYCIFCAKNCSNLFPQPVQEKLNRIVNP